MQVKHQPDDSIDEFQQLHDQLLMYTYSEQIPSIAVENSTKKKGKIKEETPKLELVITQKQINLENYQSQNNKLKRKVQCHIGKIIKLGNAIFKSNFESGNIGNVEQIGSATYKIDMDKEISSNRMSAWFYFSCEGLKGEVNFVIEGFTKKDSLYNQGMKICYREVKQTSKWRRGGTKISYSPIEQTNLHQLRFTHFFKTNEQTCIQFAYCFPYTYKKLQNLITHFNQAVKYQSLGKSFDGRDIPLLTIGNPESQKVIVLSARVHPGETVSSFIMEGFLKELVGESQFGTLLKQHFLFKVVPMINPDGVARGNYRFSTSGYDLNRKWKVCQESKHPEIYYLKEMIKKINKQKKVAMFIDIHGHSRKKNVFFYGCCQKQDQNDQSYTPNSKPKQFPFLMEKVHDAFKYEYCSFAMQKDKDGTARITMWKELRIDYIYTLESSFCGNQSGSNYLEADYEKIGRKLCEGITTFFFDEMEAKCEGPKLKYFEKIKNLKKNAAKQLYQSPYLLNIGGEDNSGSDSQPEKGEIPENQRSAEPAPTIQTSNYPASVKQDKNPLYITKQFVKTTKNHQKYKSEAANSEQLRNLIMLNRNPQLEKTLDFQPFKFDRISDIKITNNINTFELDALKSSSLYQKNVRVHSLTRNVNRSNKMNFEDEDNLETNEDKNNDRTKINLMHVREGAQYRRVRKMAEQSNKRQNNYSSDQVNIVRGLANNNIQIQKSRTIAPRFYPISQQRNRRTSAEMYFKRQPKLMEFDGKRLSINGDELNVRCLGNKIYF